MSEQKLVSPLLDGFQMGDPISSHDGVRCCPAIRENSDQKYIVKILSIPASQNQLDALLLTGAFQDAAGALNYFKELADDVVREAQLHQKLARLDGFVPCEAWQVVPMEDNHLGYDVYLLTPYHHTLERHLKKNALTHLEAVNLGLDLCAALAASRRAGCIHVDLKPSNVFISADKEYLIGDLGFISMDSMKYAALPTKYLSRYCAPEMQDALATISPTADIYALGLILYQVYNDGQLPFEGMAPAEELPPPANADYEMAEIILKACHPDPAQRWQEPTEMGQALVAYMQRNTINDVPILPPVIEDPDQEEAPAEEALPDEDEIPAEETEAAEDAPAEAEADAGDQIPAEAPEEPEEPAAEEAEEAPEAEEDPAAGEAEAQEDAVEDILSDIPEDETTPDADTVTGLDEGEVSEETSAMLAQADELAALEVPDPVVVPDAALPAEEAGEAEEAEEAAEAGEPADADEDEEDDEDDEEDGDVVEIPIALPDLTEQKQKAKKWLLIAILVVLLGGLGYGAGYYYNNHYLIPVEDITLTGGTDTITAQVAVDAEESRLTAICTDTYGNTHTAPVVDGTAMFTGLNPGTQYIVSLDIDGFNQLTGKNTASFTTTQQTNIVSISATTGAEDGSVILSFTIDGSDPQNWTVEYAAEGVEAQTLSFTGHMVTIPGLNVGSTYTFRLYPTEETDVKMVGNDTLEFTVSKVVLAQNVGIAAFADGVMTVGWEAPADVQVPEWTIHCTGDGYDQTLTVTDCAASFSGVEVGKTYTLEVLAQGMTQSVRAEVTPQTLSVSGVTCTPVGSGLRVTWDYQGDAPAAGWQLSYTVNGSAAQTLTSQTNAADLPLLIPGAVYEVTVSGVTATYEAPAAGSFSGHGLKADDLQYSLCLTPAESGWDHRDVKKYASVYTSGESISLVVYAAVNPAADDADVQVLYLIRDADGKVLTELAAAETLNWKDMWQNRYFYPTLPHIPAEAGSYTAEVYFDGALALSKRFTIE